MLRVEFQGKQFDWFDISENWDLIREAAFVDTLRENITRYFGIPRVCQIVYGGHFQLSSTEDFATFFEKSKPCLKVYDSRATPVRTLEARLPQTGAHQEPVGTPGQHEAALHVSVGSSSESSQSQVGVQALHRKLDATKHAVDSLNVAWQGPRHGELLGRRQHSTASQMHSHMGSDEAVSSRGLHDAELPMPQPDHLAKRDPSTLPAGSTHGLIDEGGYEKEEWEIGRQRGSGGIAQAPMMELQGCDSQAGAAFAHWPGAAGFRDPSLGTHAARCAVAPGRSSTPEILDELEVRRAYAADGQQTCGTSRDAGLGRSAGC